MSQLSFKARKFIVYSLLTGMISSFLFFLLGNIFLSQLISPLYFRLINNDKSATITFLTKIKNFPDFSAYLDMNTGVYGDSVKKAVFAKDQQRKEEIKTLEVLLEKNPKSRDLLYDLYLLYHEDGNSAKTEEYLRKAREVDPLIQ